MYKLRKEYPRRNPRPTPFPYLIINESLMLRGRDGVT